jgi:phage terminase large subunit-like protein
MLIFGLKLGSDTRCIVPTTPRAFAATAWAPADTSESTRRERHANDIIAR